MVSASSRPGPACTLAFITSRTATMEGTDLLLDPAHPDFAASGLRVASLVRCGKLMTLNHNLLTGRLGVLSPRLMAQIDTRLKEALELS